MQVKIIKVTEEMNAKYGKKCKVLHADNGAKYRVNESNKCWDYVKGEGPYMIEMGSYNGHPFVKTLRFQGVYKEDGTGTAGNTKNASGANFDARIAYEKERQKEIKLECYAGIAKDICLYNAGLEKKKVNHIDVMSVAHNLMMLHDDILENKEVKELPEDVKEMVEEVQKVIPGAYEGELPA